MAQDEFERALSYANSTLSLLKRGEIPPYPQFYELFYIYSTGVNKALNERINAVFSDARLPSLEVVESLYNEFLKTHQIDERVNNVSGRMCENIDSVQEIIRSASKTARSYSGSLEEANSTLDADIDPAALKLLTKSLLAKTRQMQTNNKQLEDRLEATRAEMASLQGDLDEVRRDAMTDSLTNLSNRKHFDRELERLIQRANETNRPLCLVMIDIDHFKTFNDTYGHQTGDQVLRLVAATLRKNVRVSDVAARYGGEEFSLILPNTELKDATIISNKIRKTIQAKELLKRSTNEKLGRITASFGISRLVSKDSPATLIERADLALYAAKHAGRNKVVAENDKLMQTKTAA
ncbi:MAG TPA: diguanylate cyclase [Devosia sp.]|nr:diguanylate cyclase [Devosia sp.]